MKYSIIIPVYNGEETIGRCLDSILTQDHPDTEIILINDGSTDGTDSICSLYAAKYPEIRYYSRENGGVSSARNLGLFVAEGEYILFADSDDWVSERYFSRIDRIVAEQKADLIQFSWESVKGDRFLPTILPERTLQGAKQLSQWTMDAMRDGTFGSLWSKVFTARIIQDNCIRFPESLKIAEDWVFIFYYILCAKSYTSVKDVLYQVSLANDNSLSRKRRDDLSDQLFDANLSMKRSLEMGSPTTTSFRTPLAFSYYRSVYSACKELQKYSFSRKERRKRIRQICDKYAKGPISPSGFLPTLLYVPVYFRCSFIVDRLTSR